MRPLPLADGGEKGRAAAAKPAAAQVADKDISAYDAYDDAWWNLYREENPNEQWEYLSRSQKAARRRRYIKRLQRPVQ